MLYKINAINELCEQYLFCLFYQYVRDLILLKILETQLKTTPQGEEPKTKVQEQLFMVSCQIYPVRKTRCVGEQKCQLEDRSSQN